MARSNEFDVLGVVVYNQFAIMGSSLGSCANDKGSIVGQFFFFVRMNALTTQLSWRNQMALWLNFTVLQ